MLHEALASTRLPDSRRTVTGVVPDGAPLNRSVSLTFLPRRLPVAVTRILVAGVGVDPPGAGVDPPGAGVDPPGLGVDAPGVGVDPPGRGSGLGLGSGSDASVSLTNMAVNVQSSYIGGPQSGSVPQNWPAPDQ